MSAVEVRLLAKPRIRKLHGYWRVSAVPVKWLRLRPCEKRRWVKAHEFVTRMNAEGLG